MNTPTHIGLLDSGLGAQAVRKHLQHSLPHIQISTWSDPSHFPYGSKHPSQIQQRILVGYQHLKNLGCTHIALACNSATAALQTHKLHTPQLLNPITPTCQHAAIHHQLTILTTPLTQKSNIYTHTLKQLNPTITIQTLATPTLATHIQQHNTLAITQEIQRLIPQIQHQTLILGCTHFSFIQHLFPIHTIDSATCLAQHLAQTLKQPHTQQHTQQPHPQLLTPNAA